MSPKIHQNGRSNVTILVRIFQVGYKLTIVKPTNGRKAKQKLTGTQVRCLDTIHGRHAQETCCFILVVVDVAVVVVVVAILLVADMFLVQLRYKFFQGPQSGSRVRTP